MADQMTRKQKRAAEILVAHPELSHEQVGVEAGYTPKGARGRMSHNLRLRKFQEYVDHLRREMFPKLTRDHVAHRLQEILEIPINSREFNPNARISAGREIARMFGWGKEEAHDDEIPDDIIFTFEGRAKAAKPAGD